jgi:hypothetical protein
LGLGEGRVGRGGVQRLEEPPDRLGVEVVDETGDEQPVGVPGIGARRGDGQDRTPEWPPMTTLVNVTPPSRPARSSRTAA